jgi:hypothetical protein
LKFAFTLAAQLGRTIGELLDGMSSAEFGLWQAFHRDGGFGEQRADWRQAISGAAICQAFGAKVRAEDLLPKFRGDASKPKTLDKLRAWLTNGLPPERFFGSAEARPQEGRRVVPLGTRTIPAIESGS